MAQRAQQTTAALPKYRFDVLVVGTGHAGVQVAISLRQGGFGGSIALISEDTHAPYDRPSLSKDYLMGKKTQEQILLAPATFWDDKKVDLILGQRVDQIDPEACSVRTSQGRQIGFGKLVWAAGGRGAAPLSAQCGFGGYFLPALLCGCRPVESEGGNGAKHLHHRRRLYRP